MSFRHPGEFALVLVFAGALLAPIWVRAEENEPGETPPEETEVEEAGPDEWYDDEDFYDEYAVLQVSDPFEPFNRSMHNFNATTVKYVYRPVAQGYEKIVPGVARRGLSSFFQNLRFPVRLVSNLLQGDLERSFRETEKFVINTTVGVAGFIKVSDRFPDLRVPDEDVGQAFGKWGLPRGPYLVVPLLGPYTLRDGFGGVGDFYLTPMNWGFLDKFDAEPRIGVFVLDKVVMLPDAVELFETADRAALDPYIALRNGYVEYREAEIKK